jgi:hypothetical protein
VIFVEDALGPGQVELIGRAHRPRQVAHPGDVVDGDGILG